MEMVISDSVTITRCSISTTCSRISELLTDTYVSVYTQRDKPARSLCSSCPIAGPSAQP